MATDVEIEISSLLVMKLASQSIAEQLYQGFHSSEYSLSEKHTFLNALIQMGFYKEALSIIATELELSKNFPWKQFLFLLSQLQATPSKEQLDAIFEGAKEQNNTEDLSALREWESWDERFKEARLTTEDKNKEEYQKKIEELQEKVKFLRSQRLYDEERKLLNQLHALYPKDQQIENQLKNLQEIWSKEVISTASSNKANQLISKAPQIKNDPEIKKRVDHWLEFIKEKKSLNKDQLYNLALFFKFIEAPTHALKTLEGLQGFAADWLRVDVYLDSQHYIMALEEISKIEQKYSDDPETSFATTYAKAITLKHLDQTLAAIELMQNITQVKSDYRAAYQYLKDWTLS